MWFEFNSEKVGEGGHSNVVEESFEHVIGFSFVFHYGVSLGVSRKGDSVFQMSHLIDVFEPEFVDGSKYDLFGDLIDDGFGELFSFVVPFGEEVVVDGFNDFVSVMKCFEFIEC